MSDLIATLRAIVRDELARVRPPELGIVTAVQPRDGDGSDNNHQVNVRLRSSGVELQHVPVAVGRLGWSALPNEGDLVVVTFIGGDLNAPIVLGCVYDDQARPPVAQPHEVVYQPPDPGESGVRRFHLELSSGTLLTVDDDVITVDAGGTTIEIKREGDVTLKVKGKVTLEADGNFELKSSGDITLEAQGNATLKGTQVTAEASAAAKVKGAQVTLAGITQFSAS